MLFESLLITLIFALPSYFAGLLLLKIVASNSLSIEQMISFNLGYILLGVAIIIAIAVVATIIPLLAKLTKSINKLLKN